MNFTDGRGSAGSHPRRTHHSAEPKSTEPIVASGRSLLTQAFGWAKSPPAPFGALLIGFFLHPNFSNFSDFLVWIFWSMDYIVWQIFGKIFHIFAGFGSFFRLFGSLFLLWCLFWSNFEKSRRLRRLVKIGFGVTFVKVVEALGYRFLNGSY